MLKFPNLTAQLMNPPLLYRQLHQQLRQWITPRDQRHLQGVCEAVAAILQSKSACLSHWIPYLSHRGCTSRSPLERLSYFVHNPHIQAETLYAPLIQRVLQAFEGQEITLTLDTSVLWDQFCLIEVCVAWGGRSLTVAQVVLDHGSATVGFEQYCPVLERAAAVLPAGCRVILLADRGFEHGELIRWLRTHEWEWAIRAKSDLKVTLASGRTAAVGDLFPPAEQAYLFQQVSILQDIDCHLATAHLPLATEPWAVLTSQPSTLQTFAKYGERFGGIEPHFKDYKSAAFEICRSHLRDATALTCLVMLLDIAYLIAWLLGVMLVQAGHRSRLDWHSERGLSFLQLGLRELERLLYHCLPLPPLRPLPPANPPPACASRRKRDRLARRIEFSHVTSFSS